MSTSAANTRLRLRPPGTHAKGGRVSTSWVLLEERQDDQGDWGIEAEHFYENRAALEREFAHRGLSDAQKLALYLEGSL